MILSIPTELFSMILSQTSHEQKFKIPDTFLPKFSYVCLSKHSDLPCVCRFMSLLGYVDHNLLLANDILLSKSWFYCPFKSFSTG